MLEGVGGWGEGGSQIFKQVGYHVAIKQKVSQASLELLQALQGISFQLIAKNHLTWLPTVALLF